MMNVIFFLSIHLFFLCIGQEIISEVRLFMLLGFFFLSFLSIHDESIIYFDIRIIETKNIHVLISTFFY